MFGDFNLDYPWHVDNPNFPEGSTNDLYYQMMLEHGLSQQVRGFTRGLATLDLLFVSCESVILGAPRIFQGQFRSDHRALAVNIKSNFSITRRGYVRYNFRGVNIMDYPNALFKE